MHAAVIVINQTIENGDANATLQALQNPNAHLVNVHVENADYYQDRLLAAKQAKRASVDLDVSFCTAAHLFDNDHIAYLGIGGLFRGCNRAVQSFPDESRNSR